jgi:hypothetical protein
LFGAADEASASQSPDPPSPFATVTVTLAPGATAEALTVKVGPAFTVNPDGEESPPPGAGENTVTCAVPAAAKSLPGIEARSCVLLTKVVARSAPFHRTMDAAVNPVPLTVSVSAPLPVKALDGESPLIVGGGVRLASTVIGGLVAARVEPLFRNSRNSYVPAVDGIVTVHVRVVIPAPTYVHFT